MKTAAIVYIVLIFVASLMGLIIIYKLLRRCLKLVTSLSGVEARFIVIALGLATVLFPTVLPHALKSFLWFGLDVSARLPEALRTGWYQALKDCSLPAAESDQALPARCIIELGLRYLSAFTTTLKNAYADSSIYRIQFEQFIYLIALWVAISLCFRHVTVSAGPTEGGGQSRPWLGLVYDRLSPVSRKNILFFVILGIGAYLSIAAITAIPAFLDKGAPTDQVTRELSSHLDDDFKDQQKHLTDLASDPRTNYPFQPLEKDLAEKKTEPGKDDATQTTASRVPRGAISQIEETLSSERNRRESVFKQWKLLLGGAEPHATSDKVAALNAFQLANSGRVGTRETNQHSLSLETWYRTRINTVNSQLNRCRNALVELDSAWQPWVQAQVRFLDSPQETRDLYSNYYPLPDEWVRYSGRECTYSEDEYDIPTRATLGSFLGPFGLVARWLVETESLHLALITGLLGFGLLGSACSSFIREQTHGEPNGPLVSDLASIVIRGSSAAIVVFLAVEGGLGIFSGGTAEPNPYVLLFTCLVASVFSEDVWAWAQKKLKDELGKEPKPQAQVKNEPQGKQESQRAEQSPNAIESVPEVPKEEPDTRVPDS